MKLEKFDYKIGNKKTKREFIILGVLCLALVVVVVLYKTFANFTANASFDIISGKVADFSNTRQAIVSINIGKPEQDNAPATDKVTATIYDDKALVIAGEGEMINFTDNDLIGKLLDKFITDKVTFTQEEADFINANQPFMKAMFNYSGRSFMARDNNKLDEAITAHFTTKVENEDDQVDEASINLTKSLMSKVANAGFSVETIEITDEVKNLGNNTFCLMCVSTEEISNLYASIYEHKDYNNNANVKYSFNMLTLDASLDSVGTNATSDLVADNFTIEDTVTKIPNDLFAWFTTTDTNYTLTIPSSVKSIGINAFYLYNGKAIVLPASIEKIDSYAFAAFNGDSFTIPNPKPDAEGLVPTLGEGAFRDFTKTITLTIPHDKCPATNNYAIHATVNDVDGNNCYSTN